MTIDFGKQTIDEQLAEAILDALKIREESYDKAEAEKELNKPNSLFTDFDKFYKISLYESADKAASKIGFDLRMTQPIYLLIKLAWNDIQDWAKEIKSS